MNKSKVEEAQKLYIPQEGSCKNELGPISNHILSSEVLGRGIIKSILFAVIFSGILYAQDAKYFAYNSSYNNLYYFDQPLGTPHMERREIIGDTTIYNAKWFIMKTTASGSGQSGSLYWFVRACDTIIDDKQVTTDTWTRDFLSINTIKYTSTPKDTITDAAQVVVSNNCNEFQNFGLDDSCISTLIIGKDYKSYRTYSSRIGLVYSNDSTLVFGNVPARYFLKLYSPTSISRNKVGANQRRISSDPRYLINGSKNVFDAQHQILHPSIGFGKFSSTNISNKNK